jgi:hypothetical protein
MLMNTRRRALGLLAAAAGLRLFPSLPRAFGKTECFATQAFGQWKGVATQAQAGARISQLEFANADTCDLHGEIQIGANFDGKLVLYGDPEKTRLPKTFLIRSENRLILRGEDGNTLIDEALCGTCTDIHDDKVSVILPLACAPLFRESRSLEMAVKLGEAEECRFKLDCEVLRKALDWASARREALAQTYEAQQCTPPQGCFITSACCEVLGLEDDCFELCALRHYRDGALARMPGGNADIALYYELAPALLRKLPETERASLLLGVYARFILPSAIAAKLGRNRLAYRLYVRMMHELVGEFAPDHASRLRRCHAREGGHPLATDDR